MYHHGIKGMKWGVRRYQKKDGSLTPAGQKRNRSADDRAERARGEAASAHKLAKRYTDAMDRKAIKRTAQANASAIKKTAKINKKIGNLENLKKSNKMLMETSNKVTEQMQGKGSKTSEKTSAYNKAVYKKTEVTNNYKIAKQQAKKDPSYKESTEYKNAKKANSKERTHEMIHGSYGSLRINTLKERGYSNKSAVARTYVESIATGALIGGLIIASNRS